MDQVQSHTNDRSIALSVKASKMTARTLAKVMQAFLRKVGKPPINHGKQSLKSLARQGASIENIAISGDNIGSFRKVARKYNIDFALKKDSSTDPPNWLVFFKAKDGKAISAAFDEFSKGVLKEKTPMPPIETEMARFKEMARGIEPTPPIKVRGKDGPEL